jgi:hypothetical protein
MLICATSASSVDCRITCIDNGVGFFDLNQDAWGFFGGPGNSGNGGQCTWYYNTKNGNVGDVCTGSVTGWWRAGTNAAGCPGLQSNTGELNTVKNIGFTWYNAQCCDIGSCAAPPPPQTTGPTGP